MIKTLLTGFIFGLILILFIPATLILASWNAVPGDSTYKIKVGLEKVILGVTPSDNLKTSLEIKYTERRFAEVEKLIDTKSVKTSTSNTKFIDESLTNLTNQAIASKNSLQKIQNVEEKTAQREILITTLESISVKIEEKKQVSNTISSPTKVPTKIPTKIPTNIPEVNKPNIISQPSITSKPSPTFTPVPTLIPTTIPTPIEINDSITNPPDLDETQEVIDGIIDELKGESTVESTSNNKKDGKPSSIRDKKDSDKNNREKDSKDNFDRRP